MYGTTNECRTLECATNNDHLHVHMRIFVCLFVVAGAPPQGALRVHVQHSQKYQK